MLRRFEVAVGERPSDDLPDDVGQPLEHVVTEVGSVDEGAGGGAGDVAGYSIDDLERAGLNCITPAEMPAAATSA